MENQDESSNGQDLSDITIELDAEELGKEEGQIDTISPQSDDDENIEINFDEEDAGNYDILIEVTGLDEDGSKHGATFEFKLEIEFASDEDSQQSSGEDLGTDIDADGIANFQDNCPFDSNPAQEDADDDGDGDACDARTDVDDEETAGVEQQAQTETFPQLSTQRQSQEEDVDEEIREEDAKEDGDGRSFVPFMIGFLIGIIITAGFFILIRT